MTIQFSTGRHRDDPNGRLGRRVRIAVVRLVLLLGLALAAVAISGCGGDAEETSPAALEGRLLPASEVPRFKRERAFEWNDAIDLTVQGLFLPQSTPPSRAVDLIEDARFEAAVGEELVASKDDRFQGPRMTIDVVQLGSDDDAREVLDFLHKEDLKQPRSALCSQNPGELEVEGIPGAKGAEQVPRRNPPEGAPPPFVAYAVEFAVGPVLYVVAGSGGPGELSSSQVLDAAKTLYERARG
jgi:hypothetical protein